MNKLIIIFTLLILSHCVSLKSVSITPQPANRSKKIEAEVSKFIFLAFNFNNDFVEELPTKLIEQCKTGTISGIVTRYEQTNYFLFHTMTVRANAYCLEK
ncbi:MAG: hypothetical protein H7A25_03675 [Leptospiraceae bacterium]|nr:hypothetical protein [Leptospiraceae bacterium]MCP5498975.1 hypothetical protein [Leptospiraceae bacterium]